MNYLNMIFPIPDSSFTLNATVCLTNTPPVKFKGWGTSLCWWANALGDPSITIRDDIADALFSPPPRGLGLNVVRYNIGGGDDPACHKRQGAQPHHFRHGGDVPGWLPHDDGSCTRLVQSGSNQGLMEGLDTQADARQLWFLHAAKLRGANIFEAFSNSPPWWMTHSGCTAGWDKACVKTESSSSRCSPKNNLKEEYVDQFAMYLVRVMVAIKQLLGIEFQTLSPMNEPHPDACNWQAGNNQEGCNYDVNMQMKMIKATYAALQKHGLHAKISGCDETATAVQIDTWVALDDESKSYIGQINSHTYSAIDRVVLHRLAILSQKPLWMSEMCYGGTDGKHDHQSMNTPLQLAESIALDLGTLQPECWVYWQAVEDEANAKNCAGNWGVIHADMSPTGQYSLEQSNSHHRIWDRTKKYWAMAQFTHFIRPGSILLAVKESNQETCGKLADGVFVTVAYTPNSSDNWGTPLNMSGSGFDPISGSLVVVLINKTSRDVSVAINYSMHGIVEYLPVWNSSTPPTISLFRTSATEDLKNVGVSPSLVNSIVSPTAPLPDIPVHLTPESITTMVLPGVMMASETAHAVVNHSVYMSISTQHIQRHVFTQGVYKIVNVFSKHCLTSSTNPSGQPTLVQSQYRQTPDQHWRFVESGMSTDTSPVFSIMHCGSGKLVDIHGCCRDNGAIISVYGRNGQSNQQWRIKAVAGRDAFIIASAMHNKVMDVAGWNIGDGANVVMWDENGGDNQLWLIEAI
ncbi:hypothetical protein BATDEDRAFT_27557 [Batrachochytrium dendrobatidis JAM81]|uniref:Ricin B lectin domain-containing protein n=2 Tax=Batrachochytrium dendrobatidis TaxID=109871 RepID=F4PB80_BATDJ|nr:uncharacterized protein BATDEDRAFT_27557 [Batrachochytrium dendrobatidis JAM81]EGF77399.1 hypothetical protein BATDEDRAFT_27557 [Batrachochytrium dendrobatidis JAM81]OAJ37927.1 hypothetical protein BDEG_21898 [Batrachochytrium dendrobatidis JEL423]|eukprot:XP_006681903.1 hypothetical protein BATDEDRAFT_27557 [Batrachochytrium dendrobatidis JAM81]